MRSAFVFTIAMIIGPTAGVVLDVENAAGADYSKVERSVLKEPAYQTNYPMYALLAFGPEAKTRAWLVLDGREIYVDRNGDGDLTGENERFKNHAACRNVEFAASDGKTKYNIRGINIFLDPVNPDFTDLHVEVDIRGLIAYGQYSMCQMAESPREAPIVPFDGPLSMFVAPPTGALEAGDKPSEFRVAVGTLLDQKGNLVTDAGVLLAEFASRKERLGESETSEPLNRFHGAYVRSHNGASRAFPEAMMPAVDIEFLKAAGGQSIKKKYDLDHFCCGGVFYGRVPVPEQASLGKARVTLSFPSWIEGCVSPATIELPIVKPKIEVSP
jgi:hypothetical protein